METPESLNQNNWSHQDWQIQKPKSDPILIPLGILLMLRALVLLGFAVFSIYAIIADLSSGRSFFRGIWVAATVFLLISSTFLTLDILSFVKLLRNKRAGKIITAITSSILVLFFMIIVILEREAIILLIPFGFNLAILILSFLVKLNPLGFTAQLAQPIFENQYPQAVEYRYPSQQENPSQNLQKDTQNPQDKTLPSQQDNIYPPPTEYKYQKPQTPERDNKSEIKDAVSNNKFDEE